MNPRRLLTPDTWTDFARETVWNLTARTLNPGDVTWKPPRYWQGLVTILWPNKYRGDHDAKWLNPLRDGLEAWVQLQKMDLPQPYENIAMIAARVGHEQFPIAIDFADRDPINEAAVAASSVYFKYQHRSGGYGQPKVVPGGYVPNSSEIYRYLPHLRKLGDANDPLWDVYGRFSLDFAGDTRRRAVELLNAQTLFRFEGGLKRIRYSRFLREVAQARICIDLPGNGPLCFRLFDYMAVGACIIGPRPAVDLPHNLESGVHLAWCKDDLSDLVELCRHYLDDEPARQAMVQQSRHYFDHYIHQRQLAGWYLKTIHDRIAK